MREAASRGFFLGSKAPFGYKRVKVNDGVKERPKLEVDPAAAPVVKEAFESSLQGNGLVEQRLWREKPPAAQEGGAHRSRPRRRSGLGKAVPLPGLGVDAARFRRMARRGAGCPPVSVLQGRRRRDGAAGTRPATGNRPRSFRGDEQRATDGNGSHSLPCKETEKL